MSLFVLVGECVRGKTRKEGKFHSLSNKHQYRKTVYHDLEKMRPHVFMEYSNQKNLEWFLPLGGCQSQLPQIPPFLLAVEVL